MTISQSPIPNETVPIFLPPCFCHQNSASHSADILQTTFCPAKPRSSCSSSQSCQNLLSLNIFHFRQPALSAPFQPIQKKPSKSTCKSHYNVGYYAVSDCSLTYRQAPVAPPPTARATQNHSTRSALSLKPNLPVKPGQGKSSLVKASQAWSRQVKVSLIVLHLPHNHSLGSVPSSEPSRRSQGESSLVKVPSLPSQGLPFSAPSAVQFPRTLHFWHSFPQSSFASFPSVNSFGCGLPLRASARACLF
jgi:hypothetical protein